MFVFWHLLSVVDCECPDWSRGRRCWQWTAYRMGEAWRLVDSQAILSYTGFILMEFPCGNKSEIFHGDSMAWRLRVIPCEILHRIFMPSGQKHMKTPWSLQGIPLSLHGVFSGRKLAFTFAICYRRSVCRLSVCLWRWCTLLNRLKFWAIFFTIR